MSTHASTAKINQKEYLKKYLSGVKSKKKKKEKKKLKASTVKIIDDDIPVTSELKIDEELLLMGEDAPQIVGSVIDEVAGGSSVVKKWKSISETDVKPKQEELDDLWGKKTNLRIPEEDKLPPRWRKGGKTQAIRRKSSDSDKSPVRAALQRQSDSDNSPPRSSYLVHGKEHDQNPHHRKKRDQSPLPKKSNKPTHLSNDQSPPRKAGKSDTDQSPARRRRQDSDHSPVRRRRKDSDQSPARRHRRSSNQSPARRRRRDSDQSPVRHNQRDTDKSSPVHYRRRKDSDQSPVRRHRRRRDSDQSPKQRSRKQDSKRSPTRNRHANSPLKIKKEKYSSNSPPSRNLLSDDQSPPRQLKIKQEQFSPKNNSSRKIKKESTQRDIYPARETNSRWGRDKSASLSPPPTHKPKPTKTLDGKRAGLQDAKTLKDETDKRRRLEERLYENMPAEISGRNAEVQVRNTGRRGKWRGRDIEQEDAETIREREEYERKKKEHFDRLGKGVKQVEDYRAKVAEEKYEGSKPLARYAHDEDLDRHLREQERPDDPMLEYMRKKKREQLKDSEGKTMPIYEGPYPPNRFGIRPGYRWDGVDRSNGYEKKWFEAQSEKRARQDDAYKYSIEDM